MFSSNSPDFPALDQILRNSRTPETVKEFYAIADKLSIEARSSFQPYVWFGLYQTAACNARPVSLRLQTTPNSYQSWPSSKLQGFPISRHRADLKFDLDKIMLRMRSFGLMEILRKRIDRYWSPRVYKTHILKERCRLQFTPRIIAVEYGGSVFKLFRVSAIVLVNLIGVGCGLGVLVLEMGLGECGLFKTLKLRLII